MRLNRYSVLAVRALLKADQKHFSDSVEKPYRVCFVQHGGETTPNRALTADAAWLPPYSVDSR